MTSLILQKWKKNQIYEAVRDAGLNPKEFELKNSDSEVRLELKWSKSYFILDNQAGKYVGRYVVGDAPEWPFEAYSWQTFMERIIRWLAEVKQDLDTPDLWEELQREAKLLQANASEFTENTPFSGEEQKELSQKLQVLVEYVRTTHPLSADQLEVLNEKIDYLIAAAGRLGRIDWRGILVGEILGYVLSAMIPPETARSIVQTFQEFLRDIHHLFVYGLPGLPIG